MAGFVPFNYSFVFLPFDLSFCGALLTALILQRPYIPKLPRICKRSSRALANGYFAALAEADLKIWKPGKDADGNPLEPPSSGSTCQDFYSIWTLEVVILYACLIKYLHSRNNVDRILYLISVIIGILSLFSSRHGHGSHPNYYFGEATPKYDWIWTVLVWPFNTITSGLRYLRSGTRFIVAYVSRSPKNGANSKGQRPMVKSAREYCDDFELDYIRRSKSRMHSYVGQHAFQRLVGLDTIMEVLAKELHANDIRHIGQAFPGIRAFLYNYKIPNSRDRDEFLDNVACKSSNRSQCWACNIRICSNCTTQVQASGPDIEHHMNNCIPYCHRCYFHEICRKKKIYHQPDLCAYSQKVKNNMVIRSLCKPCGLQITEKVEHRRAAREKKELALLADQAIRCGNCASGLPSRGPRWWVCNLCLWECKDSCHQSE